MKKIYLAANHYMTKNLAKLYPNKIGYCLQPGGKPSTSLSYFVDNGAFSDFCQNRQFREKAFLKLLETVNDAHNPPDFVVVPDRVNDNETTRELWDIWSAKIRQINSKFRLAYVVQPGKNKAFPMNVPIDADVIFIGGGKPWKFEALLKYRDYGKPIHIGGITASKLYWCHLQGACSGDSSGFFRGDMTQLQKLYNYLADATGEMSALQTPPQKRRLGHGGQLSLF